MFSWIYNTCTRACTGCALQAPRLLGHDNISTISFNNQRSAGLAEYLHSQQWWYVYGSPHKGRSTRMRTVCEAVTWNDNGDRSQRVVWAPSAPTRLHLVLRRRNGTFDAAFVLFLNRQH